MRDRADGAQSTGEAIHTCKMLMSKPQRKKTLGARRHRWEDNIKVYFTEMCRVDVTHAYN